MEETLEVLDGFEIPDDFELPGEEITEDAGKKDDEPEKVDESVFDEGAEEKPDTGDEEIEVEEPSDEPADGALFKALASQLKEEGFFNDLESVDEITDVNKLSEAFKKEVKSNEFRDLNETQRRVLEAFRAGVPEADIINHEKAQAGLMSITDDALVEDEELRKNVILSDLKNKGISDNRALKMYNALYDSGEDIEEAKISLQSLKEIEQKSFEAKIEEDKRRQAEEADSRKKELNKLKESIDKEDKFLGEISITDTIRENVHKAMSVPVDYLEDGTPINKLMKKRMDDPIAFEKNLYYLFELTNGFEDLKIFDKKAKTKATKKLSEVIGNSTFIKGSGKPQYQQDPESYAGSDLVELI